ncbi:LexA family protein [Actinoplanes rectilineatus]|uniref:LexA family protein n=1 Tax=Actinoplanes rectilineatus TaxID=113571 RepID=UPI0009FAA23A|nr:MarR family transcriptional regulator [Actinoplanes rectilineatus]
MSAPSLSRLPAAQQRVLDAIHAHMAEHRIPPTVREVAAAVGRSASTTTWNLDQLVAKGYLHRQPGVARGLFLADPVAAP